MRKISMTTSQFMKWGNEPDAFAQMAGFGFTACDYSPLDNIHGEIYKLGRNEWAQLFADVKQNAAKAGVQIYQAHGPWVWPKTGNDTEEGRAVWMQRMLSCLDACARMECPHLVVHPIMPFGAVSTTDEEAYLRINREFWEKLLPAAEQYGVTVLLENMPFLEQSLSTVGVMAPFVESFHSKHFAMCFDTGHSLVFGEKLDESVRTCGQLLRAFHVHDNGGDRDSHLVPGFGVGDWDAFRAAVNETVDKSVPISLECKTGKLPRELEEEMIRILAKLAASLAN